MNTKQQATDGYPDAYSHQANTALVVVEYGDYTNACCQLLQPVLKNSLPEFGEAIRHTFRHFPNLDNPQAISMALAAEAARRQGQFWPMHQALFAHNAACSFNTLSIVAVTAGLQLDRFLSDLHDETVKELVLADVEAGRMASVTKVPTLFVGTHRVLGKLTQARLGPLIRHYLHYPLAQVLSTVNQAEGIIIWSNAGYLL